MQKSNIKIDQNVRRLTIQGSFFIDNINSVLSLHFPVVTGIIAEGGYEGSAPPWTSEL